MEVWLQQQGAAETHCVFFFFPLSNFFAVFVVFKWEQCATTAALITPQSSILISPALNLHRLLGGARQPTDVTAWCLSAKNEADPEPEMPLGRAIIFLNAPVKHKKCTCLVGNVHGGGGGMKSELVVLRRFKQTRCGKAWRWCSERKAWSPAVIPPLPTSHVQYTHMQIHPHTHTHAAGQCWSVLTKSQAADPPVMILTVHTEPSTTCLKLHTKLCCIFVSSKIHNHIKHWPQASLLFDWFISWQLVPPGFSILRVNATPHLYSSQQENNAWSLSALTYNIIHRFTDLLTPSFPKHACHEWSLVAELWRQEVWDEKR